MKTHLPRVLLIEDEPVLSSIYEFLLRRIPVEVLSASDGVRGLELIQKAEHDLVLLDLMLPKMDGVQILQELRRASFPYFSKIILLTNLGQENVLQEAMAMGVRDYLIKSDYNPQEFSQKIAEHIGYCGQSSNGVQTASAQGRHWT